MIRRWLSSWRRQTERRQLEAEAVRAAQAFVTHKRSEVVVSGIGGVVAHDGDALIVRVCWGAPRIPPPYDLVRVGPNGEARWLHADEKDALRIGPWR